MLCIFFGEEKERIDKELVITKNGSGYGCITDMQVIFNFNYSKNLVEGMLEIRSSSSCFLVSSI